MTAPAKPRSFLSFAKVYTHDPEAGAKGLWRLVEEQRARQAEGAAAAKRPTFKTQAEAQAYLAAQKANRLASASESGRQRMPVVVAREILAKSNDPAALAEARAVLGLP